MKINRTFWYREKGSIKQAFSYAKDTTATNFAKKYGGSVLTSMDVTLKDNLEQLLQGDVYSILHNDDPITKDADSGGEFSVLAKAPGQPWHLHGSYPTISDANTEAKAIITNYESVLVLRDIV